MKKLTTLATLTLGASMMASPAMAGTTLKGIFCGDEMADPHKEFVKGYESRTGNKVNVEMIPWGQCQDKVFTLAAAGSPPDFAYMGSRTLGQLADSDLIESTNPDKSGYYPNVLKTFIDDNGTAWSYPIAFSSKAMYYNKDLFAKAGYNSVPTTWDGFLKAAEAVKAKTGVPGYGMHAKANDATLHQFLNWFYSNGGHVLKGGKVVFDSKQAHQTTEFLQKLAKFSQSGPAAHDRNTLRELFNVGKVAAYISGPWDTREGRINKDVNWGLAKIPHGPMGGHGTLLITDSVVIFKGTGNEKVAHAFAKEMTNPENQLQLEKVWKMTPMRPHPEWKKIIAEKPEWQFFIDGIANGGPEPLFKDFRGAQETFIQNIQALVTTDVSPKEVVETIQEDLENLE